MGGTKKTQTQILPIGSLQSSRGDRTHVGYMIRPGPRGKV